MYSAASLCAGQVEKKKKLDLRTCCSYDSVEFTVKKRATKEKNEREDLARGEEHTYIHALVVCFIVEKERIMPTRSSQDVMMSVGLLVWC